MSLPDTAQNVAKQLRDAVEWLDGRYFERADVTEGLALAALTGLHMLMLGTPGTGKSDVANDFTACLGGNYFWQQMDLLLTKEEFFGPLDMKRYEQTGEWMHDADGYLPTADVVALDEVGKTGPAVLTMLLTAFNERRWRNGKQHLDMPLLFAVGTTNEMLDDPSGAMFDRFTIRVVVEDFASAVSLKRMLRDEGRDTPMPKVDLDSVRAVSGQLKQLVTLPEDIIDQIADLRALLHREHSVSPSPRRFNQAKKLLRGQALLNGRDVVNADDLAVLRHVLWESPEQIKAVTDTVLSHSSPAIKELVELSGMLDDVEQGWTERAKEGVAGRANYAGDAKVKLAKLTERLAKITSDSPRVLAKVSEASERAERLLTITYQTGMGMPMERAQENARKDIENATTR